jgi:hypothetical protein
VQIKEVRELVQQKAEKDLAPLCWLINLKTGQESEQDYCPDCAKREAGCEGEHVEVACPPPGSHEVDSFPSCHVCETMLDVTWTEALVSSELDHFEEHGVESPYAWRSVLECIDALYWRGESGELHNRLLALVEKQLGEGDE